MDKPRLGRRYGHLSLEEAKLFLPDSPVVEARWVTPGAAFTEIKPVKWAHIHVLGLVTTRYGLELSGPGAAAAGWGLRSYSTHNRGWIYFETRKAAGRRRRK